MIIKNDLYRKSINIVKPHEFWDLFEIIPTAPLLVYSGAFLCWEGTDAIVSHLIWGDIWDSVGSSISILFVLKYTRMVYLRTQNICGVFPSKCITSTRKLNNSLWLTMEFLWRINVILEDQYHELRLISKYHFCWYKTGDFG